VRRQRPDEKLGSVGGGGKLRLGLHHHSIAGGPASTRRMVVCRSGRISDIEFATYGDLRREPTGWLLRGASAWLLHALRRDAEGARQPVPAVDRHHGHGEIDQLLL